MLQDLRRAHHLVDAGVGRERGDVQRRAPPRARSRRRTGCGRARRRRARAPPTCQKCGSSSRAVGPSAELSTWSSRSASTRRPPRLKICARVALDPGRSRPCAETKTWATANAGSSASFGAWPPLRTSSCQIARGMSTITPQPSPSPSTLPARWSIFCSATKPFSITSWVGLAVPANGCVERAGVLVLDGLRRPQRPVGLGGRIALRLDACASSRLRVLRCESGGAQFLLPGSAPSSSGRATGS